MWRFLSLWKVNFSHPNVNFSKNFHFVVMVLFLSFAFHSTGLLEAFHPYGMINNGLVPHDRLKFEFMLKNQYKCHPNGHFFIPSIFFYISNIQEELNITASMTKKPQRVISCIFLNGECSGVIYLWCAFLM